MAQQQTEHLKETGDGSEDFEDVENAVDRVFLFVEIIGVDGDVAKYVGRGSTTKDLDGTNGVEHNSVDLTVLDIINSTFTQGYDIAVVDLWFHRMASDIAP